MTLDMEDTMKQLVEDQTEQLHPDLLAYYNSEAIGGMGALTHPLVYSVPFFSNGMANRMYEQKLKQVARALDKREYLRYIFLHERPYRLEAFMEYAIEMSDHEYWKNLSDIWIDTENMWQNRDEWVEVLNCKRGSRASIMDHEDDRAFMDLPDQVTIYRGCVTGLNENGLSWTLDKERAQWFSTRLNRLRGGQAKVLEKTVHKSEILAVFVGRGEAEVVLKQ